MSKKLPFATIGDEPIEARIVAWVLGDASAFEATELERLCDERPELLVFRRRMRALHSLLTEAETAEPDHSIKLPAAKRQALDEIFGKDAPPNVLEHPRTGRSRRLSWHQRLLAIAACLILFVGLAAVFSSGSKSVLSARKLTAVATAERQTANVRDSEVAIQELKKVVRAQEDTVEERRKVLANIVRSKGIIYSGSDSSNRNTAMEDNNGAKSAQDTSNHRSDAIKRGLDAQDYVDAKREFEAEQTTLQQLKMKLIDKEIGAKVQEESLAMNDADADRRLAVSGKTSGGTLVPLVPAYPPELIDGTPAPIVLNRPAPAPAAKPTSEALASRDETTPQVALAKTPQPSPDLAVTSGKPVAAESASSSYKIPDKSDHFSETAPLASLGGGGGRGFGNAAAAKGRASGPVAGVPSATASSPVDIGVAGAKQEEASGRMPAPRGSGILPEASGFSDSAAKDSVDGRVAGLPTVVATRAPSEPSAPAGPALSARKTGVPPVWEDSAARLSAHETPSMEPGDLAKKKAKEAEAREKAEVAIAGSNTYTGGSSVNNGTLSSDECEIDAKSIADEKNSDRLLDSVRKDKTSFQSALVNSDRYLVDARDAYAKNNYQLAYDNYAKGLALLPEAPATKDRRVFLRKSLGEVAAALANDSIKDGKNDEAKDWLGKAVEWDPSNNAARQKVVADVASEATAADSPYSTFSLSISDTSFKMAKASMARGERPDPSSIKIEQFYNAVDYGDPAPGPNEAVAGRVEQAAHPIIPGRNLVRVAVRTGAAGRSAAQPLRLTLLVDQSGSMARDDRRAAMTLALKQLAGLLTKNDLVTVIGFSRSPRLLADALTGDQAAKLNELVNQAASEGGTNLEEAMILGEQLAMRHQMAAAQNRIVLFTDGAANLGDADPSRLAEKVIAMRQKGLAFDIAGIGTTNLNDQLLAELARHGNGRYCVVGAETDADGSFARQLAGAFRPAAENVKVQVCFNPQRVGRYKLLGFEEHRLKTEDFRNDGVDAAELAAEEAGVALYQVEPISDGSGELGEASLRFRDAASGQMVERTWTIPYDAAAPAFDRATPSLQLAGLALMAAEKLRGGTLAEAIDFKQLAAPRATVKQFYSYSRRVAEMLEMVDKL